MSVTLSMDLTKPSDISGLDEEHIGPFTVTVSKGDAFVRKRVPVTVNEWTTLDAGTVGTPWGWWLFNIGDNDINVGFGQGEDMTLEPGGLPGIWTGQSIPYARGSGGSSVLLYVAIVIE